MPRKKLTPIDPIAVLRRLDRTSYYTREAAVILDVNRDTVKRWIHAGIFPHARLIGGSAGYLIPTGDIKRLMRTLAYQQAREDAHAAGLR